jgi:hypothetical protein
LVRWRDGAVGFALNGKKKEEHRGAAEEYGEGLVQDGAA